MYLMCIMKKNIKKIMAEIFNVEKKNVFRSKNTLKITSCFGVIFKRNNLNKSCFILAVKGTGYCKRTHFPF